MIGGIKASVKSFFRDIFFEYRDDEKRMLYHRRMATKASTAEFLVDQLSGAGDVRVRKMFGEYALYCDGKVAALICDDRFYIKSTEKGRTFIGTVEEAPPYPGAKDYFLIDESRWDDHEWMCELVRKTADSLPVPTKKR